ncbi:hypothetical protein CYY_002635 [Polysphondylium violaceum]|uniref:phosphatidylinositol-3,4,5-trisphosphate 5-phosphatase n=1 Tax=Polysphondylium violaceum TaxID=133409 RepID=A0A8J4PY56_9MYCE|nr:hypothetical protein CYY_002635 [Polysphondylium violaceum]
MVRGRSGSLSSSWDPKNLSDLENYYKSIKVNILDYQFEFIIKKNNKSNRTLLVLLKERVLQIFKLSKRGQKKKFKKYDISKISKLTKSKKDNKEIIIYRRNGKKELTISFINTERRECFYELLWLAWLNKTLPTSEVKAPYQNLSFFVSTWNMGDAPPPSDLNSWIPKDKYDLYILGVQECEYSPRERRYEQCQDDWFGTLATHLGHNYYKVEGTSLVKMRIVVFARKEHYYTINYIEKTSIPTGIGGVYGNKGATMISFQVFETSFCFISSHFAAHQEKIDARNHNYREIVKVAQMGNKDMDILNQFNYVFWMGDFNYRIDHLFREEVLVAIKKKDISKLLIHDQLLKQKAMEKVFFGFKEEAITFYPTYKMERHKKGVYTEEKQRTPSWCDRILTRALPYSHPINCVEYKSATNILTSDHVPVYGVYECFVRLPCLPVPQSLIKKCNILFFDLRAENLDLIDGQSPDPYLVFHPSSFIEEEISTPHASKNRSPIWGDILPIEPTIHRQTFLETQHLLLTIYHDDEVLGHAAVPLALGFSSQPFPFATRITKYGLQAGILYGAIHIVYLNENPSTPLVKSPLRTSPTLQAEQSANSPLSPNINTGKLSPPLTTTTTTTSSSSPPTTPTKISNKPPLPPINKPTPPNLSPSLLNNNTNTHHNVSNINITESLPLDYLNITNDIVIGGEDDNDGFDSNNNNNSLHIATDTLNNSKMTIQPPPMIQRTKSELRRSI